MLRLSEIVTRYGGEEFVVILPNTSADGAIEFDERSDDERDIDGCYRDGANSYIQKPVNFKGFIDASTTLKEYWFEIALLPKYR